MFRDIPPRWWEALLQSFSGEASVIRRKKSAYHSEARKTPLPHIVTRAEARGFASLKTWITAFAEITESAGALESPPATALLGSW